MKSLADTAGREPVTNSKKKPTITKDHKSLAEKEENRPKQAIKPKKDIHSINENDTLDEKVQIVELDDLLEEGYVVVEAAQP